MRETLDRKEHLGLGADKARFSGTNLQLCKHTSAWPQAGLSGLTWSNYAGYVGMHPSLSGHQAHCGGVESPEAFLACRPETGQETRRSLFLVSVFILCALAESFSGLVPFASGQKNKNQRMHLLKFHGQMCLLVQTALHSTMECWSWPAGASFP